MNKEANAEAMIDRARIVSVDADADADADADVTSPHHSRLDGWDGEAWWIVWSVLALLALLAIYRSLLSLSLSALSVSICLSLLLSLSFSPSLSLSLSLSLALSLSCARSLSLSLSLFGSSPSLFLRSLSSLCSLPVLRNNPAWHITCPFPSTLLAGLVLTTAQMLPRLYGRTAVAV